ncbi:MAG: hypothetical protein MJ175_12925, partial [Clostridia bacterium]|nr:hypothetical protein [Clostridia bacterium]
MKNATKAVTGLLLLAIAASTAACGSETSTPAATDAKDSAPQIETEAVTEDASIPKADFEGYQVNFLVTEDSWGWWHIGADEETGETLQDATWARNRQVEDRLNIKIAETSAWYSETPDMLSRAITAGDYAYDVATMPTDPICKLSAEGMLLGTEELPNLKLSEPWWNEKAIRDIAIGKNAYMLIGDIHQMFYESHYAIMFNRELITKYDMESPYNLVADGKWTFDTMHTMAQTVSADVNGDGAFTPDSDTFGICLHTNSSMSMILALGASLITRDADGAPVFNGVSERYVEAYQKVCRLFSDKNVAQHNLTKNMNTVDGGYNGIFTDGRSLFLVEVVGELSKLRSMNNEFGIVAMPKFDEASDYITPVYHGAMGVCVPMTSDPERTSTVLETMARISYDTIRPAYYDVMLGSKLVRDEKSTETLDVILKSGSFEIAYIYDWGGLRLLIEKNAYQGKEDITSIIEKES